MNRLLKFSFVSALMFLAPVFLTSGLVLAQQRGETVTERSRPELDPLGVRVGSFYLYPKLSVTQAYDDNIFRTDSSEEEDFITVLSPSLRLKSNWNNHSLTLGARADVGLYGDNSNEDYEDYFLDASGVLDITRRAKAAGSLSYARRHEGRGEPDDAGGAEPTEYDQFNAAAAFKQKFNRLSATLGVKFLRYDFDDVPTVNNDDRDRDEHEVYLRLGYEIVPAYEAFILGSFNHRDYDDAVDDDGVNRDSDGYEVVGGVRIDLSGTAFGDVFVGYHEQDYDDSALDTISGVSIGAALTWNVSRLTTFKVDIKRTIEETTQTGASGYFATVFGLSVDHELLRNFLVGGKASFSRNDYEGISREDDHLGANIYGKYMLSRNLYATLSYDYRDRDSSVAGDDYTSNVIMLRLETQY